MIYLGINVSHGASAALMINGKIVMAYQEERFNKIKNFVGYPKKSIEECIKYVAKII
jgi:carbamoyltransferase